ncbi:MAG: YdeI/OmpD-associated family protein [Candidatus Eisenbacteria bacterium]
MTVYSFYEQEGALVFPGRTASVSGHRAAGLLPAAAPSYQRTSTFWVVSAKQEATRERRARRS